mmetsp:Transcript_83265/g.254566  ORF Transcript_83265/g.254566 Transcript_83265/m.254566 type:complete len:242 (+) Transcript_83265:89-814(+)
MPDYRNCAPERATGLGGSLSNQHAPGQRLSWRSQASPPPPTARARQRLRAPPGCFGRVRDWDWACPWYIAPCPRCTARGPRGPPSSRTQAPVAAARQARPHRAGALSSRASRRRRTKLRRRSGSRRPGRPRGPSPRRARPPGCRPTLWRGCNACASRSRPATARLARVLRRRPPWRDGNRRSEQRCATNLRQNWGPECTQERYSGPNPNYGHPASPRWGYPPKAPSSTRCCHNGPRGEPDQ